MVGVARTRGDQAQADGFEAAATKQTFFESVDVLSLHLRLNSVTKGCVTASDLSVMETWLAIREYQPSELVEPEALLNELTKVPSKSSNRCVWYWTCDTR